MGNPSMYFFSELLNTLQYQEGKREREGLKGEVCVGVRRKTLSKGSVRTKSGKNANRNERRERKRGNPEKRWEDMET